MIAESSKDESKPHKCPEEIREDAELKIPKNVNNKNNVCELFYDTRSSNEYDKENDGNALDDTDHVAGNNMIRRKSHDTAANGGLCYTDKNVTACDSPEIVACYKESTYHVVKDICVDEGVPVQEKFLFGEKDSVKCNPNSDQCEPEDLVETKSPEDRNNSKVDDPKTKQEVEESSREGFADAESSSSCNQEHLIVTREAKEEVVTTSENVLTLGGILSREDEQKTLNNDINNSHGCEEQSPSQLQENEQRSLKTPALKTEEPRKTEEKLSSVSTTTSQKPERPATDQKLPDLLVGGSFEEDKLFSSGFGETSFSAGESVSISGHISHSGPVVVSGRHSVRSDASTTSGRSFAFPVLQSEWNSSPERMAKAEKRRLKGWREILLCCRFS
ncbi:18S pre-ribosomal assembly protein gar2-like protein [Hirschfeldia incana]|nr:18S pre-ribosomal assembly protein gar2-like protein [Hirschfeldia incana]